MLAMLACLPLAMLLTLPFVGMICVKEEVALPGGVPAKALAGIFGSMLGAPFILWFMGSFCALFIMVILSSPMLMCGYFSMTFLPDCATLTGSPMSSFPVAMLMSMFMLIFTCLALVTFAAELHGMKYDNLPIQKMLQVATSTVAFVPMLSVLFLGYRQVALWSGSEPGWSMKFFMLIPVLCQIVKSASVFVIPVLTGECIGCDFKTGEIRDDCTPFSDAKKAQAFGIAAKVSSAGTYVGALLVLLSWGTHVFTPFWALPAPYTCVGILCFVYFATYGGIYAARQYLQFLASDKKKEEKSEALKKILEKIEETLMTATCALNLAPVLCATLLLGRRLGGTQSSWFETLPAICATMAMVTQTILSIAVPLVLGGDVRMGRTEGDMEYCVENRLVGTSITIARYLILVNIYAAGAGMHLMWMFTKVFSSCSADLPGMAAVLMALMFWRIYMWVFFAALVKEFTGFEWALVNQTFENTKGSVQYVPTIMIVLLSVDPQMRGLLSFLVTYSLPVALLSQSTWILFAMFQQGVPGNCDLNGCVIFEPENELLLKIVKLARYSSFGLLYGGMIAGCLSMLLSNF